VGSSRSERTLSWNDAPQTVMKCGLPCSALTRLVGSRSTPSSCLFSDILGPPILTAQKSALWVPPLRICISWASNIIVSSTLREQTKIGVASLSVPCDFPASAALFLVSHRLQHRTIYFRRPSLHGPSLYRVITVAKSTPTDAEVFPLGRSFHSPLNCYSSNWDFLRCLRHFTGSTSLRLRSIQSILRNERLPELPSVPIWPLLSPIPGS
jgi:hypothetical protein